MEILFCSHPSCSEVIAMKFCTWHDSSAVVACSEFSSDVITCNGVTLKPNVHQIWIMMEKIVGEINGWAMVSYGMSLAFSVFWRKLSLLYQHHTVPHHLCWSSENRNHSSRFLHISIPSTLGLIVLTSINPSFRLLCMQPSPTTLQSKPLAKSHQLVWRSCASRE